VYLSFHGQRRALQLGKIKILSRLEGRGWPKYSRYRRQQKNQRNKPRKAKQAGKEGKVRL